ncbi:MAG: hypothetical protein RSE94_11170, partial [Pseudomonas sp.]
CLGRFGSQFGVGVDGFLFQVIPETHSLSSQRVINEQAAYGGALRSLQAVCRHFAIYISQSCSEWQR